MEEQFKIKNKKAKKKKLAEKSCKKVAKKVTEEDILNQEETNLEVQQAVENPEYVEVEGITADPAKVEPAETIILTDKEVEVLHDLSVGEKVLLPNEEVTPEMNNGNVGGATEFVKVDDIVDVSGTTDEIISDKEDIEGFISLLLDGEDEDVELVDDTKDEIATVDVQESFQDNMVTDINELDFPDAMHSAVDTKKDGSLIKLSDVLKQIQELKESVLKELAEIKADIKAELKTGLSELRQDVKDDVKDVQTSVTSKLDNTDARIADLTTEEEEEEEVIETGETPAEDTVTESLDKSLADEILEKQQMLNYCLRHPLYEKVKAVILSSPLSEHRISIKSVLDKLQEAGHVSIKATGVCDDIVSICEYTPLNEYIIEESVEKVELKKLSLGEANKFLRTGLDKVWEANRAKANYANLQSVFSAQQESVEDAKKVVDKYSQEGEAGKQKIQAAAELLTNSQEEKEAVIDYAVNKMSETVPINVSKLLNTQYSAALGGLSNTSSDIGIRTVPKRI